MMNILIDIFQTSDGHSFALRYPDEIKKINNILLVLPAMGVSAKKYDRFIMQLGRNNILAISVDLRGEGSSSIRAGFKCNFGYKEILEIDIPELTLYLSKKYNQSIVLFGHSLGGQLSCLYSSTLDTNISKLILMTSCSVYYKGWNGFSQIKVLLVALFFPLISNIFGFFPGDKLGFGGRSGRQLITDWSNQALSGKYKIKNSSITWENDLKEVNLPILSISLENDFLAPKRAVDNLMEKLIQSNIKRVHLNKKDLNHFKWIVKYRVIVKEVIDYLEEDKVKI